MDVAKQQYPRRLMVRRSITVSAAATLKAPALTRGKITPNVTAAKGSEVTTKKLSIKQDKKTVKKDIPPASLPQVHLPGDNDGESCKGATGCAAAQGSLLGVRDGCRSMSRNVGSVPYS